MVTIMKLNIFFKKKSLFKFDLFSLVKLVRKSLHRESGLISVSKFGAVFLTLTTDP